MKCAPWFDIELLERRQLLAKAPLFTVDSLVSNSPAVPANFTNANVINAWGLAAGPGTEWWVANNETGVATLHAADGAVSSQVITIPPPDGFSGGSVPTGMVFNGSSGFEVATGKPAQFIFSTEVATISGWSQTANATKAILKIDNHDSGAIYKGLAIADFNGHTYIYATNFNSGKIEIYDEEFKPVHLGGSFRDKKLPADYAPFGIQNINGLIYVTYANQDIYGEGDVKGPGHGYVDVYLPDGTLSRRLVRRGTLDSPWGVARIPGGFGKFKRKIAVANFGDGLIQVFDPKTGEFNGYLRKKNGKRVHIDGLWGIAFGNDGLAGSIKDMYFTAGPNGETDGLFGKISMVSTTTTSVTGNPPNDPGYSYPASALSAAVGETTDDHHLCEEVGLS